MKKWIDYPAKSPCMSMVRVLSIGYDWSIFSYDYDNIKVWHNEIASCYNNCCKGYVVVDDGPEHIYWEIKKDGNHND